MFWYIVICLLMLYPFCIVRAGAASDRKTQCVALGIACFILWIFMAMRGIYVGVDTQYYSYIFTQFADIPITKVFTAETFATASETWSLDFEYGYRLYNKLISYLSCSQQTITICNSTIIIVLLFFLIRKQSPNFMLSIWLYLTLGIYQTEMNVTRNAIAILIVYLAFIYWEKRRPGVYVVCCLLAASFHKAAFLFIPLYWVFDILRWNIKRISFAVVMALTTGIIFPYIAPTLRMFLPYAITKYFESSNSKLEAVVVGVFYLIIFAAIYLFMNRRERSNVFTNCHLGVTLFTFNLCCFALNFGIGYAARVAALFGPYIIIFIPQVLQQIESERKRKELSILISLICVCQYILRLCINNIGGTMPYVFFW